MDRGQRRHHMERMRRRVRRYYGGYMLRRPDAARYIGMIAQTRTLCSCLWCGNPRRHFGQKTRAERLNERALLEALQEGDRVWMRYGLLNDR